MTGKAFLLPFARLLMSSLFVWDGILQLRSESDHFERFHHPSVEGQAGSMSDKSD